MMHHLQNDRYQYLRCGNRTRIPGITGPGYLVFGTRSVFILHRAYPVCGFFEDRCQVPGIGYRLSGTWDPVPGTGAESAPKAEHRAPKTESGYRKTRT
jgi:hypothetical protein